MQRLIFGLSLADSPISRSQRKEIVNRICSNQDLAKRYPLCRSKTNATHLRGTAKNPDIDLVPQHTAYTQRREGYMKDKPNVDYAMCSSKSQCKTQPRFCAVSCKARPRDAKSIMRYWHSSLIQSRIFKASAEQFLQS